MSSRKVLAHSGWAGGNQETPLPDHSHTRSSPSSRRLVLLQPPQSPQPLHSLKMSPAVVVPRRPHHARLVPRRDGPVEDRTAMEHAAVLVRGPALVPRDVRRDQPEHSLPLETERATSSAAWQRESAVTRRHDTASKHIMGVTHRTARRTCSPARPSSAASKDVSRHSRPLRHRWLVRRRGTCFPF